MGIRRPQAAPDLGPNGTPGPETKESADDQLVSLVQKRQDFALEISPNFDSGFSRKGVAPHAATSRAICLATHVSRLLLANKHKQAFARLTRQCESSPGHLIFVASITSDTQGLKRAG